MRNDENIPFRSAGLCSTCDNATFCIYRAWRGFDAQYCELFENSSGVATGTNTVGNQTVGQTEKRDEPVIRKDTPLKGLCINCEIRETCKLPRPIDGVWHCEEYQ